MQVFPSSLEATVFVVMVALWIITEAYAGIAPRLRRNGKAAKMDNHDSGSNLLFRVSSYAAIIIAFLLAIRNITMLPDWLVYPGIALMAAGILVRQWSVYTLGQFFTFKLGVQKDQKVIDHGPYRLIRHPSYLGMLMVALGIGVSLRSFIGIIAILVLYGIAIGYRIRVEERLLVTELGDDYVRYMKRTKRLIPFIL